MSSISITMPSCRSWRISRPTEAIACTQAEVEAHWEPTWNVMP